MQQKVHAVHLETFLYMFYTIKSKGIIFSLRVVGVCSLLDMLRNCRPKTIKNVQTLAEVVFNISIMSDQSICFPSSHQIDIPITLYYLKQRKKRLSLLECTFIKYEKDVAIIYFL